MNGTTSARGWSQLSGRNLFWTSRASRPASFVKHSSSLKVLGSSSAFIFYFAIADVPSPLSSRPDPCSVDFGPETPKFRFENCRGFLCGFFPPVFSKEKGPKKSTKKSTAKFTREFVRKNSPRISAEAFSGHYRVFLNTLFGEPVVCTPDSRSSRHFVVSVISANPALDSLLFAVCVVFVVFVVFMISAVFVKGDPHANHRFRNAWH